MLVGATYGAAVVVTGALVMLFRRWTASRSPRRGRAMSFGSACLANGVFPEPAKAWETIINTVMYFDKCPSLEKVVAVCEGLMFYDRFRSALRILGPGRSEFVDISSSISIERDIIRTLEVGSDEEMTAKIDELCSNPFPVGETHPLFMFYRLQHTGANGRSATLVRLHHAIGDGIALIGSMGRVFQDADGNPFKFDIPSRMGGGTKSNNFISLAAIWQFITSTIQVIALPASKHDSPMAFTAANKKKGLTMKDAKRCTVYFPVLKLDFVKEVKNRANVTVNDVMLAVTAGALRRYCTMEKDPLFPAPPSSSSSSSEVDDTDNTNCGRAVSCTAKTADIQCRTLMPVAFPRSPKELSNPALAMRNYFAMISVPLPMAEGTCKQRLERCAASTRMLKTSPLALVQLVRRCAFV
jgi:hypothetical protein